MEIGPALLALAIALPLARALGALAARLGQPPVLGELCAGLLLSTLPFEPGPTLQLLAEIGAAVLLFEAGLDSDPRELARAGLASTLVACAGVIAPTLLGALAAHLFLPQASPIACLFIGGTLSATSVGITVRVLRDLHRSDTREARIVIGAAVVDDVLGLLLLSLLVATARAQDAGVAVSTWAPLWLFAKAALFLGGSIAFLPPLLRRLPHAAFAGRNALPAGLALCFALSWLADAVGLAPVVGAFVAGVALSGTRATLLKTEVQGIAVFVVPIFFVSMGLRVDLPAAFRGPAPLLALALVAVAIVGKLVSGLAAPGRGLDRLVIGVAMIPRGEVGLIFAGIGQKLAVRGQSLVGPGVTSGLVLVMLATTLLTPPLLRWAFNRKAALPAAVPDLP